MTPISNIAPQTSLIEAKGSQKLENPSREKLESVGTDFESVFMSMMIKEMRNSLDGGFFGEESSDTYGGMFDLFIGKHLAESRPLGIANMMLDQYEKTQQRGQNIETSPDAGGVEPNAGAAAGGSASNASTSGVSAAGNYTPLQTDA